MRLKSFYAKTSTEAMRMVRDTLGEDAVIVATREEKGGDGVRVTAAVEQHDQTGHDAFDPCAEDDWMYGDEIDPESAVLEKLTDVMLRHSVPEEITDQIISCATVIGLEQPDMALTAALEHMFSFKPLPKVPSKKAFMLVGPPASGKTLAVAKLAARGVMNNMRVSVISTDTVRAGGVEQLSAFTKLMNITLLKAKDRDQLATCIEKSSAADQVFIDTGGLNPFEAEEIRNIAKLISAGDIEPILTMPAGVDAEESGEIARIYSTLGIHSIIPTRLDIARRLGGILSAAYYGHLVFAEASKTPKVADGLFTLTPNVLTHLLMPESVKKAAKKRVASRRRELVNAG